MNVLESWFESTFNWTNVWIKTLQHCNTDRKLLSLKPNQQDIHQQKINIFLFEQTYAHKMLLWYVFDHINIFALSTQNHSPIAPVSLLSFISKSFKQFPTQKRKHADRRETFPLCLKTQLLIVVSRSATGRDIPKHVTKKKGKQPQRRTKRGKFNKKNARNKKER